MRLWTVQPVEVWGILQKQGYFICDPKKSDYLSTDWGFKEPYDWLVKQMEYRIGKRPKGVKYPIWAWHTRDWKYKKPDLRNIGLGNKGEKSVCIEIEIPDNEVLLHDYDAWHYVLNKWWYDDSLSEEDWERKHEWFDRLPYEKQKMLTEKSWERIFDVIPFKNEWTSKGRYIQATFWVLYLKDVKDVRYFIAR